jgi:hypothetical protein
MRRFVGLLVVCACAGDTQPVMRAPAKPSSAATPSAEPRNLGTLARWVDELPAAGDGQRRVASVIDLLADYFVQSDPGTSRALERNADELARSPKTDVRIVRASVSLVLDSLASHMQLPPDSLSRSEYMMARRARLQIRRGASIGQQLIPIGQSLRAITNLIAIRRGDDPPFPPSRVAADVGYDKAKFASYVQDASEAVHEVATLRDWKPAAQASGDALDILADAIATAPLRVEHERWRLLVREAHYRASKLALTPAGVDRSDDIKAGLRACTDALQYIQLDDDGRGLARLATDAADQIDSAGLFTLQRAVVQEAFRALVDALYVSR